MRRAKLVLAAVIIALLAAPLAVIAAAPNKNYLDKFDGGYGGSNGSLFWAPDWTEVGENDGHNLGAVRVAQQARCATGNCLHIDSGLILLSSAGAMRQADTSGFTSSRLTYHVRGTGGRLGGTLIVQVWNAGGGNWVPVESHTVTGSGTTILGSEDISAYADDGFAVQFLVSSLLLGPTVLIDDVEIEGEIPVTTTTSTSTTSTTTPSITVPSITVPSITATTVHATTTTSRQLTTTTTTPRSTTTEPSTDTTASGQTTTSQDRQSATSTTVAGTTTTTSNDDDGSVVALGPGEPPEGGGSDEISLYQATRGIQAGLSGALFADVALVPVLDPVDVDLNFGLFAEEIETSWLWMTLFGLVLTWAMVSDLDRRRFKGPRARAPSRVVS